MVKTETRLNEWFESVDERIEVMNSEIVSMATNIVDTDEWKRYLEAAAGFHQYSFRNQMLVYIQFPEATKVASKTYWRSVGRKLKPFDERGNGITIFRAIPHKKVRRDSNGNETLDENGKPIIDTFMTYSTATIYDVSQTVAIDPDDNVAVSIANRSDLVDDTNAAEEAIALAEQKIAEKGYTVEYRSSMNANGYADPTNKVVVVNPTLGNVDRAMTLLHEMGHIYAGHCDEPDMGDYREHRGHREVEAEGIAYMMANIYGIPLGADTNFYIAGWASKIDKSELADTMLSIGATIQRVVKDITD